MFLEEIKIIETSPCLAEKDRFKALTSTSVSLTEILPYLNAVVTEKPNYQPNSGSFIFKKGRIRFTLMDTSINITKFANMTELLELLDWIKDLINDTYKNRANIEPNHKAKKILPVLKIYNLLPKTNCKECGEETCMAFASGLNKSDKEIDDCPPLGKSEFAGLRQKLINEMA